MVLTPSIFSLRISSEMALMLILLVATATFGVSAPFPPSPDSMSLRINSPTTNYDFSSYHFGCEGKLVEVQPMCPVDPSASGLLPSLQYCDAQSPLDKYIFVKNLDAGGFGETVVVNKKGNIFDEFVLKKIKRKKVQYTSFYQSGVREAYFGRLVLDSPLQEGKDHVARFVESFAHEEELYVVSFYEGTSLRSLIYDMDDLVGWGKEKPSSWWTRMRETAVGREVMQKLIRQLLTAIQFCHHNNITHRDLKPANIVICFTKDQGSCSGSGPIYGEGSYDLHLRIIDFGSALDDFSVSNLYLPGGPSRAEQTFNYMPPEALIDLSESWSRGPPSSTSKYDMWMVGQIIMELVLGSPYVFTLNTEAAELFASLVKTEDVGSKLIMYRVMAFLDFCIIVTGLSNSASSHCSDESFSDYIKSRDPLIWGSLMPFLLRLVRQLLAGNPDQRWTADEALCHPYFHRSSRGRVPKYHRNH